jgi:SAM-dependent methyltransferase
MFRNKLIQSATIATLSITTSILFASSANAFILHRVARRSLTTHFGTTSSRVEQVLRNAQWPAEWPYSKQDFERQDESDDSIFYNQPRLVLHIDDPAVAALTSYYQNHLKDVDDVLDICSSWVSHYPKTFKGGKVVGLGMNIYELSQNPQLTEYVVKDLNNDPSLPFEDNSFDKVTCVVSIDYLNQPLKVILEVGRVLRPGGVCILSMSNRCFPTKAFRIWLQTSDLEHVFIAGSFFHYAGMFDPPTSEDISPNPGRSDPLFIVKATKKSEPKDM